MLILSCGAALHHARVSLAAAGYEPVVHRVDQAGDDRWIARVSIGGTHPVHADDTTAWRSIRRRHTDRRPFQATVPVPATTVAALHAAADAEHAWLHRVDADQVTYLRAAAVGAQTIERKDVHAEQELQEWTGRAPASGDGVSPRTVVAPAARPVPLRGFGLGGAVMLEPGPGDDRLAEYLIVVTAGDEPVDWLRAGEATSAVWLTATTLGLAVSPMSEVVEVPGARVLLRSLLHRPGNPQLVLRAGVETGTTAPAASQRRPAREVVSDEPPARHPDGHR